MQPRKEEGGKPLNSETSSLSRHLWLWLFKLSPILVWSTLSARKMWAQFSFDLKKSYRRENLAICQIKPIVVGLKHTFLENKNKSQIPDQESTNHYVVKLFWRETLSTTPWQLLYNIDLTHDCGTPAGCLHNALGGAFLKWRDVRGVLIQNFILDFVCSILGGAFLNMTRGHNLQLGLRTQYFGRKNARAAENFAGKCCISRTFLQTLICCYNNTVFRIIGTKLQFLGLVEY